MARELPAWTFCDAGFREELQTGDYIELGSETLHLEVMITVVSVGEEQPFPKVLLRLDRDFLHHPFWLNTHPTLSPPCSQPLSIH